MTIPFISTFPRSLLLSEHFHDHSFRQNIFTITPSVRTFQWPFHPSITSHSEILLCPAPTTQKIVLLPNCVSLFHTILCCQDTSYQIVYAFSPWRILWEESHISITSVNCTCTYFNDSQAKQAELLKWDSERWVAFRWSVDQQCVAMIAKKLHPAECPALSSKRFWKFNSLAYNSSMYILTQTPRPFKVWNYILCLYNCVHSRNSLFNPCHAYHPNGPHFLNRNIRTFCASCWSDFLNIGWIRSGLITIFSLDLQL
jgi:hypothetical protein